MFHVVQSTRLVKGEGEWHVTEILRNCNKNTRIIDEEFADHRMHDLHWECSLAMVGGGVRGGYTLKIMVCENPCGI